MPDQCDNCKFYRVRGTGSAQVFECRVAEPTAFSTKGIWPKVEATDWCGRWAAIGTTMEVKDGR
jgi:hypothetical protein